MGDLYREDLQDPARAQECYAQYLKITAELHQRYPEDAGLARLARGYDIVLHLVAWLLASGQRAKYIALTLIAILLLFIAAGIMWYFIFHETQQPPTIGALPLNTAIVDMNIPDYVTNSAQHQGLYVIATDSTGLDMRNPSGFNTRRW